MSIDKNIKANRWVLSLKTSIILILITTAFMGIFAGVMYFAQLDKNLSPLLATISLAAGTLSAAYYASSKIGNKGYLTGLSVGGITFVIITLISLITDEGGITINTLFHFIIIMLSALIGGIMGVNKKPKKYI